MRVLTLVHRWLGVGLCLFFAMWFATGIVMHFVPYPALTEAERVSGLAPVHPANLRHDPAEAVAASGMRDVARVRLLIRPDGPVYLVHGASGTRTLHADDLSGAGVRSEELAVAIATAHARRRGIGAASARFVDLASHDQWTVANHLDPHRPLYRVALNDSAGTELYVSSATGEVMRDTTRSERLWNYTGSVAHWIYPTQLRRDRGAWTTTVWTLSLVALIAAMLGAVLGCLRVDFRNGRLASPYRGWHAWHHWLGLGSMIFVLTWTFSGWLSVDDGRLFSTGNPAAAESVNRAERYAWTALSGRELALLPGSLLEVQWFAFDGRIYRRERSALAAQRLSPPGEAAVSGRAFLRPDEAASAVARFASGCGPAIVAPVTDAYVATATMPQAPVYRVACGATWYHVDGASGELLEKLDVSRRAYRWAYGALHTLDFPALAARPALRTALVVTLSSLGLVFSLTAVVIGWRRLTRS